MGNARRTYPQFSRIDGVHPMRHALPDGFVEYRARIRRGGEVFYFNFDLAQEMGLIPAGHHYILTAALKKVILETFSLQIINEYDLIHKVVIPEKDVMPNSYMATRYLQLQHPDRRGYTSGDGRGIWNGMFAGKDACWDISSCGTGGTRLSPATAREKKFFKTGQKGASYGDGRSDLLDGVCTALMSDVFYRNGLRTERTLAIISFDDNSSINVRAAKNLLRPAHLFRYLKQGNLSGLKRAVDYYIERQVANGIWPPVRNERKRYLDMLDRVTRDFAFAAAKFESDYIFCWMDWDGDNILCDGGIIDYGSVRQFGLYHHDYRYDDVERMSTTITEQKNKARYIVQCFAQISDFILSGKKRNLRSFRGHPALRLFDKVFEETKDRELLYKIGFDEKIIQKIMSTKSASMNIRRLRKCCSYFEMARSCRGTYEVSDGITWDAIFCLRDIFRELPLRYRQHTGMIGDEDFISIIRSNYASDQDVRISPYRKMMIRQFQKLYWRLVEFSALLGGVSVNRVLTAIVNRSAVINRYERITGDSIIHTASKIVRDGKRLSVDDRHQLWKAFVEMQVLRPEKTPGNTVDIRRRVRNKRSAKLLESMVAVIKECRDGI